MKKDVIYECGYYGRSLNQMGTLYFCPKSENMLKEELIFIAKYFTRILTLRRIKLQTANTIQDVLRRGQDIQQEIVKLEQGTSRLGIKIVAYNGMWKSSFGASMLLNHKYSFRLGYIGFGLFFTNKTKLNFCAMMSIYGLINTMLTLHKEDPIFIKKMWDIIEYIGNIPFGDKLNNRNYEEVALKVVERFLV